MEKENYDSGDDDLEDKLESLLTSPTFPWDQIESDSDAPNKFPDEPQPTKSEPKRIESSASRLIKNHTSVLDNLEKSGRQVDLFLQNILRPYQNELEYWETGQMVKTFQTLRQYIQETPEPLFSPADHKSRTVAIDGEKPIASAFLPKTAFLSFLDKNLKRLMKRYNATKKTSLEIDREMRRGKLEANKNIWAVVAGTDETKGVWTELVANAIDVSPDGCLVTLQQQEYLLKLIWVQLDAGLTNPVNLDAFRTQLHRVQLSPSKASLFVFYEAPKNFRPVVLSADTVRSRDAIIRDRIVILTDLYADGADSFKYALYSGMSSGFSHLLDLNQEPPVAADPTAAEEEERTRGVFSVAFFVFGQSDSLNESVLMHSLLECEPHDLRAAACVAKLGMPSHGSGPLEWIISLIKHLISLRLTRPETVSVRSMVEDTPVQQYLASGLLITRLTATLRDAILNAALTNVGL